MILFKDISVSDKSTILHYTANSNRRNCDLSFSNLCSWRSLYHTKYSILMDCLVFKFWTDDNKLAYMMPVGNGNLKPVLVNLIDDAKKEKQPFRLLGVCSDMREELEKLYHNDFEFIYNRNYDDYLYLRTDLATLSGKKYQSKRNFVNRFKRTYKYEYINITHEYIDECISLETKWFNTDNRIIDKSMAAERQAIIFALQHFDELGLLGGLLRINEQIVAFTFGMPINHDTFGVHVEKADTKIEGSYAMINYEFSNHIPEKYIYINREEDLGKEGLRKAKLSYHPTILLKKYMAYLKEQPTKMINW